MALTDESPLEFGQAHRNKLLKNVPAEYLLYIYNNNYAISNDLKEYIEDNLEVLEKEKDEKKWEK